MTFIRTIITATLLAAVAVATAATQGSAEMLSAEIVAARLQELKHLHEQRLIDGTDYLDAKRAVLAQRYIPSKRGEPSNATAQALARATGSNFTKLVFSDNFETLDMTKWKHEISLSGGGNWEFEAYVQNRSNSFVRDGVLYLKPTMTADVMGEDKMISGGDLDLWGGQPADLCTSNAFYGCERTSNGANIINPIQSARLRTAETFNFKYGRVEINASLPRGDWIWPALWMLPTHQAYGVWPASGEIDIMESRGNDPSYPDGGVDQIGSTLHWGPFFGEDRYPLTHATYNLPSGQDFASGFHIFGLEWSQDRLFTYVDTPDNVVLDVPFGNDTLWQRGGFDKMPGLNNVWVNGADNAPFDQEYYLVMNVAVGGTGSYFPDGMGGKCWQNPSLTAPLDFWKCKDAQWGPTWKGDDVAMKVASVKVWQ